MAKAMSLVAVLPILLLSSLFAVFAEVLETPPPATTPHAPEAAPPQHPRPHSPASAPVHPPAYPPHPHHRHRHHHPPAPTPAPTMPPTHPHHPPTPVPSKPPVHHHYPPTHAPAKPPVHPPVPVVHPPVHTPVPVVHPPVHTPVPVVHPPVHTPVPVVHPPLHPPVPVVHPPVHTPVPVVHPPVHTPVPVVHPPVHTPVPPVVHPPAHPPMHPLPRSFVAVQGVVYVKSCKYAGVDTLLGAVPVLGAVVKLQCNNTRYKMVQTAKTDKNGYFFFEAPKTITTYGAHKCNVVLVSAPTGLKPSNLHGGVTGSVLRAEKPYFSNKLPFVLYTVGPLAFEPKCPH